MRSLLFFLLILVSSTIQAQLPVHDPAAAGFYPDRLERIDEVFQDYADNDAMAGSVILLARKGQVGYFKAFGYADKESGKTMGRDAIFRIASQSKAIISVGILMLQEEGKLLIGEPVSKYIPEFAETTVAVANDDSGYSVEKANRSITIRDLLTHTAGIGYGYGVARDKWDEAGITGWYFADRDEPVDATVERMAALPMDAQPGTRFVYGYNTDILGVVIERASGLPLDEFLQTRIFDPLGMKDTFFYLPADKTDRLTTVYAPGENGTLSRAPVEGTMDAQGAYVTGPRKSFSGGAGLLSTATDYYLFLQMMANGGELNGVRLLSPVTIKLMTSNHLSPDVPYGPGRGFGPLLSGENG